MKKKLNPKECGNKLRLARKDACLNQKEFAARTGIPVKTISAFESGKESPTSDQIDVMSIVLGTDVSIYFNEGKKLKEFDSKFIEKDVAIFIKDHVGKKKKAEPLHTKDIFEKFKEVLKENGVIITDNYMPLFSKCFSNMIKISPELLKDSRRGYRGIYLK